MSENLCLSAQAQTSREQIAIHADAEPVNEWLRAYCDYLDKVLGLSAGSRRVYLRYPRLFLESLGAAGLASVTPDRICDFVREKAAKLSSTRLLVTGLRVFLRFLATQNLIRPGLDGAVPTLRQWKLASLPKHFSDHEVARLLDACDAKTCMGLRDRAVLTLLARLGLRAAEVLQLRLDDINWKEGTILIRAGKSNRDRLLPLSHEVGSSLVAYLKNGRPKSSLPNIFLQCNPPFSPLKQHAAPTKIVRRYMKRAGVPINCRGAHALRHTAATSMVCRGASFKEVADILGHKSLVTTAVYVKLDVGKLASVALPWPGGEA
jgi:integrase/recombinase XerD